MIKMFAWFGVGFLVGPFILITWSAAMEATLLFLETVEERKREEKALKRKAKSRMYKLMIELGKEERKRAGWED